MHRGGKEERESVLPGAGTLRALVRLEAFSGGKSWAASLSLIRPRCAHWGTFPRWGKDWGSGG